MASFITANGYNPYAYDYLINRKSLSLNAIVKSGIASQSAFLQSKLSGGGDSYEFSDYNPLTHDEPNLSDESGTLAPVDNITDAVQRGRVAYLNKRWAVKTFAKNIVGQNPVTAITDGVADYWATAIQKRMISGLIGIRDDNVTNDSSDMVFDVATDGAGAVAAGEQISAANILHAKQTMGDHHKMLQYIIMPSLMYTRLQLLNLIAYIPNSRGEVQFSKFLEYTVIVDDENLLVDTSGTNRDKYTCILAGRDIIGLASGRNDRPFGIYPDEATGNGGGEEFIFSRMNPAIHHWGFDWTDDTRAGKSASLAELALEDNWDRKWDRKKINLAYLIVNEELK